MPNILDIPMKKAEIVTISGDSAYAKFTAKKAHIEINSTLNRGIQINSRYKSEQVSIGINDYYLASITFRRRTFPIFIIVSVFFFLLGCLTLVLALDSYDGEIEMIFSLIFFVVAIISILAYFYTKMARLSLRLADEQDYDILFSSSAVEDSKRMQEFIQKVLMNALKVEDDQYNVQSNYELSVSQARPAETAPQAPVPAAATAVATAVAAVAEAPLPASTVNNP